MLHVRVKGKRDKVRLFSVHVTAHLIELYLAFAGRVGDTSGPVFRPVTNNRTGKLDRPLDPASVYRNTSLNIGRGNRHQREVNGLCVHSLRATAATNALSHEADIARSRSGSARECVEHSALRRRKTRPEDLPIFRVRH